MKWAVVGFLILSVLHIHFRGKVRLPFGRQLFDHSSFMAPINIFMHLFSRVPSTPYIPVREFPELDVLQQNWEIIREEALNLVALQKIKASEDNNDAGFNSFFKTGWKRFYLKWYDASHPSAERLCPKTYALLQGIPAVKAAMFAELPHGAKLNPHRDPFAGSMRYHLGLATPNDDRCFIDVDGERYSWRDGQSVIFDETFIHWAKNGADTNRIILFCDIERPMKYGFMTAINRWVSHHIVKASATQNMEGEHVGALNKVFGKLYEVHLASRKVKDWNRGVYYALKYSLMVGIVGLIVLSALR
jgi:beta-hydroxylase